MGAISFIIYDNTYFDYNIQFWNDFLNLKHRGPDHTSQFHEQSPIKRDIFKAQLKRSEFINYRTYVFVYNHHRLYINDQSENAHQPFEDPLPHKINEHRDLKFRPKRRLICEGEIYNYDSLKKEFTDKDLQSNCDVEIILPLYIKYGIEETLNKLNGDFSFVITENIKSINNKDINVYCARDKYGIKPLWFITNNRNFYMFISDLNGVPTFIKNNKEYNITEVPPGTYWSFQTKSFKSYINSQLNKILISKTDPDTLQTVYKNIHDLFTNACYIRMNLTNHYGDINFGIILKNTYDSFLMTSVICDILSKHSHKKNNLHLFSKHDYTNNPFLTFLENKYKHIIIHYHYIISDTNEETTNKDIYKYIREPHISHNEYKNNHHDEYSKLKIIISEYGLNNIWNGDKVNVVNMENEAGLYGFTMRFPYLDDDFINYINVLDTNLKQANIGSCLIDKYILKKTFESYMPNDFV
jgi:asparagine synthase (glutamine-hydrolysing)